VRIFLSDRAASELQPRISALFGGTPFRLVTPPEALASDFDVAFVSRDVTGRSTKYEVEPATLAFHDALRQAGSLRWVHIHSAGADRPIYPELQSRGVTLTTSSGANAPIVAQTALAGILALARRFPMLFAQQAARQWKSLIGAPPQDLAGQLAVIVGWGPIGQHLAGWLEALGVRIVVVRNNAEPAGARATHTYDQLAQVAHDADWLVIACPLSERTRGLVDKVVLGALPHGAHVVNVGRGEVVVEADLLQALESGHLGGAFLDVFEHEPLARESPLWGLANVIVTPHSAGMSAGNEGRVADMFIENLERFITGRALLRVAAAR
jgi:phosphoglycerate dehydrogenase-like enzyme